MQYTELVPGTLIRRYKRFWPMWRWRRAMWWWRLPEHQLDASGRRARVPGLAVTESQPGAQAGLDLGLIELPMPCPAALVSVHTGRANALVAQALQEARIPELAGYDTHKARDARLDFSARPRTQPPMSGSSRSPCASMTAMLLRTR